MKHIASGCLAVFLLLPSLAMAGWFDDNPQPSINAAGSSFSAVFSPSSNVAPQVAQEISNAQKSIRLVSRRFASKTIARALIETFRAGRDVKIIVDKSRNSDGYSAVAFLQTMGLLPHTLNDYDNLYLSYMVIDDNEVILGSVATLPEVEDEKKNPIGVLIIRNVPELAKSYVANFNALWPNSLEMKRK